MFRLLLASGAACMPTWGVDKLEERLEDKMNECRKYYRGHCSQIWSLLVYGVEWTLSVPSGEMTLELEDDVTLDLPFPPRSTIVTSPTF
jgi:hypothetical protein